MSAPNLAQYAPDDKRGLYPKDFVFDGWHPQCFCFVIPVMVAPEEMAKMNEAFIKGENYTPKGEQTTEYPDEFKDWVRDNALKIKAAQQRGTEPYFVRNNAEAVEEIIKAKAEGQSSLSRLNPKDTSVEYIANAIDQIKNLKTRQITYCSFEPFSSIIAQMAQKIKAAKGKERLFESVFNHSSMMIDSKEPNIVIHPKHKTTGNWEETKSMARSIVKNKNNKVAFLPESDSVTNADAIVYVNGKWKIADFKYCISTKANTIQIDLSKAFDQGDMAVIQLPNADSSKLIEAINYIKRNNLPIGDILVLNKMGDYKLITKRDIRYSRHNKKIRGFL